MSELKLAKLPDRKPVKITITAQPELNKKLEEYARRYQETYGEQEAVPELIPYMLDQFLSSDRTFVKTTRRASRGRQPGATAE